jgi:hypothetical protein
MPRSLLSRTLMSTTTSAEESQPQELQESRQSSGTQHVQQQQQQQQQQPGSQMRQQHVRLAQLRMHAVFSASSSTCQQKQQSYYVRQKSFPLHSTSHSDPHYRLSMQGQQPIFAAASPRNRLQVVTCVVFILLACLLLALTVLTLKFNKTNDQHTLPSYALTPCIDTH